MIFYILTIVVGIIVAFFSCKGKEEQALPVGIVVAIALSIGAAISYGKWYHAIICFVSAGFGAVWLGEIIFEALGVKPDKENKSNYCKPYINHCWNCKSSIDSRTNIKCSKCNTYYICNNCGKCKCDSPYH